jgi:hypothetical protein
MTLSDIEKKFNAETFSAKWDEILEAWDDGTDAQKSEAKAWIERKRYETVEVAQECIDEESLAIAIATRYIEMECNWVMLNTLMNFKLWTGKPNMEEAFRGTLVSTLIESMEAVIDADAVATIKQFVGDPFGLANAA